MRSDYNVIHLKQGIVGVNRLLFGDIQPGAGNPLFLQGFNESWLIDYCPSSRVDNIDSRFDLLEFPLPDEMSGFLIQEGTDGDKV